MNEHPVLKATMIFAVCLALVLVAGIGISMMHLATGVLGWDDAVTLIEGEGGTVLADALGIETDLIPADDDTYDLGDATHTWQDLYLGGDSLYLGDRTITDNGSQLRIDNHAIARTATLVVAASDASSASKAQADYVCDGMADDVEIQAAIDALPAGRTSIATVKLIGNFSLNKSPAGNYCLSLPSYTLLDLSEAKLTMAAHQNVHVIVNADQVGGDTRIHVYGGEIDQNMSNQDLAHYTTPYSWYGIFFLKVTDSVIDHCYIHDCIRYGIQVDACTDILIHSNIITDVGDVTVDDGDCVEATIDGGACEGIVVTNNILSGAYASGIEFQGGDHHIASGNKITGNASTTTGIEFSATINRCIAVGNNIYDLPSGRGVVVNAETGNCDSNCIVGNSMWNVYVGVWLSTDATHNLTNTLVANNNINTKAGGWHGIRLDGGAARVISYTTINGNIISRAGLEGIRARYSDDMIIADNIIYGTGAGEPAIDIDQQSDRVKVNNNRIASGTYNISVVASSTDCEITNNLLSNGSTGAISDSGTGTIIRDNQGYISPSEVRTASGLLTAGNANAICFAWHDPEAQDILIKKVVVEVTTAGGTPGSHLDVGIADDAAGTNRGIEFFDDLDLNAVQINDSWVGGDGGTQTKYVFCQDSASATDGWIVGQILDANAANLVGSYYIEYVGR